MSSVFPAEFGELLDYSRVLRFDQLPDYDTLTSRLNNLAERYGLAPNKTLGETSSAGAIRAALSMDQDVESPVSESDVNSDSSEDDGEYEDGERYENSYFGWDLADWDVQRGRDKELTMPVENAAPLDSCIKPIVNVLLS